MHSFLHILLVSFLASRSMILPFACAHKLMIMMYIFYFVSKWRDEFVCTLLYGMAWYGGSIE